MPQLVVNMNITLYNLIYLYTERLLILMRHPTGRPFHGDFLKPAPFPRRYFFRLIRIMPVLFISPIASLGLNQGLIRYGALLKTLEENIGASLVYRAKEGKSFIYCQ